MLEGCIKVVENIEKVVNTLSQAHYLKKAGFGLRCLLIATGKQRSRTWVGMHQKKVEKT